MTKLVDSLLFNGRLHRHQRLDQLDDHLRADIGMPRDQKRPVAPFLLGSLIVR